MFFLKLKCDNKIFVHKKKIIFFTEVASFYILKYVKKIKCDTYSGTKGVEFTTKYVMLWIIVLPQYLILDNLNSKVSDIGDSGF